MSKVKQVLTIARDELEKSESKTIPKAEMVATLDQLIKTLPQAAAMDEQQLEIMVTYMNHLNMKMDLLFNATSLCGLGISNDLKTRATIKQMGDKFAALQQGFDDKLEDIVDPDAAAERDKKRAEARAAAENAQPGSKKIITK